MPNGLSIKEYQRVKQWMGEESPYRYNSTFGLSQRSSDELFTQRVSQTSDVAQPLVAD